MTDSADEARRYSFRLLRCRDRSAGELRHRLAQKGFSEEVIEETLKRLIDAGLIHDRNLAQQLKRHSREKKGLGFRAAKAFMLKRGIPADIVDETIVYEEYAELENARNVLRRRMRKLSQPETTGDRKRTIDYLARRGYSHSIIREAMKDITEDIHHEEEKEQ